MSQQAVWGSCGVEGHFGLVGSPFTGGSLAKGDITYSFQNITEDSSQVAVKTCVTGAFTTWQNTSIGLIFKEVPLDQNPDIIIEWDPTESPHGSSVLANGKFPITSTRPLKIKFYSSGHTWLDQSSDSTDANTNIWDIQSVALHEIGHCLGLDHSQVSSSVMYYQIRQNTPSVTRKLKDDDIARIRSLYNPARTWHSIEANFLGEPAVVSWAADRVDIFVRGVDNAVYQTNWNPNDPTNIKAWESLGGTILDSPCVIQTNSDRIDLFARGLDNSVLHRWWNGSTWNPLTGWESLGGATNDRPSAVSWGRLSKTDEKKENGAVFRYRNDRDSIDLVIRGTDNTIYHKYYDPGTGTWSPSRTDWTALSGNTVGRPIIVSWNYGRLDIFARGADSALFHKYYEAKYSDKWQRPQWESIGGRIIRDVTAVASTQNRLDILVQGLDGASYTKAFDGAWRPSQLDWERRIGDKIITDIISYPVVLTWAPNTCDVYVTRSDGSVEHSHSNTKTWQPWERLEGKIEGSVVANPTSNSQLFARGPTGNLQYLL